MDKFKYDDGSGYPYSASMHFTKNPPPEFWQQPLPKRYSKVTILVEDLKTGETVVHTFPVVQNFEIGVNPIGAKEYSDDTWGFTHHTGQVILPDLPMNHSQLVTEGIVMPEAKTGVMTKTQVLPK